MARTIYALLVGIDRYEAPVRPLRGCANDIRRIAALLEGRASAAGDRFVPKVLADHEATRQAIIDGFRQHLAQASAEDVALFYFSGHGSQQKSPPEFWTVEPDRLDETLVCHDSRQPGSWDLADKELAQLIAEVAERKAHCTVILDCCHSGSGTRGADETGVRRVPADQRERPLSTFIQGLGIPAARSLPDEKESGWIALPNGRHILLAACRADEEAKEYSLGGKPHGVFSYFLAETLEHSTAALTYRDLFKHVNALVRTHAALQSPQIEPADPALLDENFLGGSAGGRAHGFTFSHDKVLGWIIDAGAIHGIPQPHPDDAAIFAIFRRDSLPAQWRSMKDALGTARVRRVEANRSVVDFAGTALDPSDTYRAVLAVLPLAPLGVEFSGDPAGLALARNALSVAGNMGGPSLLIRESASDDAELRLVAAGSQAYRIVRPADGRRLVGDVDGFSEISASKVIARLEHIARWMRIAELRRPASALEGKIELTIYTMTGDSAADASPVEGTSLRLLYTRDLQDKWRRPRIRIRLKNCASVPLYCALVGLTETFAVQTGLLAGGSVRLAPGEEAWANAGKPISTQVPDALWNAGVVELRDVLKLIASTEEMDATLLEQGELDHPLLSASRTSRGLGTMSTLTRLMTRVQTRGFSTEPEEDEIISDWTTQEFTFTTVRPLEETNVPRTAGAELYPGVRLASHPALEARARLTTAPAASRDVAGGFVLPSLLRDNASINEPFFLSSTRGGAPGLSVLELSDVRNAESVTASQPLRLEIAHPLAPGEHLLALTHDGEFHIPIGRGVAAGDQVEVILNALPRPMNTRSLFSAVRIYFQKIISNSFGTEYKYPILAAVSWPSASQVQVEADPGVVRARIAAARRIVLYIHGIIGDTRGMAASAAGLEGTAHGSSLRERYDLILTFDYENLNTSIEENARLLKQRLAEAGLGQDHGKTLHIVAHSMGGLISRWFIEREGGNKIVQHLAMLGTPNGGSPWSAVEDWALAALAIGLNGLTSAGWPAPVLGSLVSAVETVDVALSQMHPASAFLEDLNSSPDPQIPYTIIAGNTALIERPSPEKARTLRNLLDRLKSLNLLHTATAPLFFGEPNDIAVSVENIRRQPPARSPAPTVREVPCDHLTYFNTQAGLSALESLLPIPPP